MIAQRLELYDARQKSALKKTANPVSPHGKRRLCSVDDGGSVSLCRDTLARDIERQGAARVAACVWAYAHAHRQRERCAVVLAVAGGLSARSAGRTVGVPAATAARWWAEFRRVARMAAEYAERPEHGAAGEGRQREQHGVASGSAPILRGLHVQR